MPYGNKLFKCHMFLTVNQEEYPLLNIAIDDPQPLEEALLTFDLDDHFNAHAELLLNVAKLAINVAKLALKIFFIHICFLLDPYNAASDMLDNFKHILRGVVDSAKTAVSVAIRWLYFPVAMLCVMPKAFAEYCRVKRVDNASHAVNHHAISVFTTDDLAAIAARYQSTVWRKHPYAVGIGTFGIVAPQSSRSRQLINLLNNKNFNLPVKRLDIEHYMRQPSNQGRALWNVIREYADQKRSLNISQTTQITSVNPDSVKDDGDQTIRTPQSSPSM